MTERFYETNLTALPYRMWRRNHPEPDGNYRWDVEYDQTEKGDWGPRGVIIEVDGAFIVRGERVASPDRALLLHSRSA